jgi:hypothetical protein
MGNRAGLNAVVNRKYHRELNPGHPARSLVSILTEFSRFLNIYVINSNDYIRSLGTGGTPFVCFTTANACARHRSLKVLYLCAGTKYFASTARVVVHDSLKIRHCSCKKFGVTHIFISCPHYEGSSSNTSGSSSNLHSEFLS